MSTQNACPPETASQGDAAYQRLRGDILLGVLAPGARLRAVELQAGYALGLTPIREALMRLTAEGLVEALPHRGARVAPITPEGLADLMATRRRIERLCVTEAMARGDAGWEAAIVAALHLLTRTPLPAEEDLAGAALWEARHRAFHHAVVAGCGSAWMLRIWNQLADHAERYRWARLRHFGEEGAGGPASPAARMNANHARIAAAVLARDPSAAALLEEHLSQTERAVARLLAAPPARRRRAG